jgi:hypothetical protein
MPGTPVSTQVLIDRTAGTSSYRVELRQGVTLVAVAQGLHVRARPGTDRAPTQTYRAPGAAADLAAVAGTPGWTTRSPSTTRSCTTSAGG